MFITLQQQVAVFDGERFAGVHETMRMENVVAAEYALHRAVDNRRIKNVLQFGNARHHVVAHVEFAGVVPLDFFVDRLVDGWRNPAVEDEDAIANEPADLFVIQFHADAIHRVPHIAIRISAIIAQTAPSPRCGRTLDLPGAVGQPESIGARPALKTPSRSRQSSQCAA